MPFFISGQANQFNFSNSANRMKEPRIPVAREGYPFILFSGFAALILAMLEITYAAIPLLILTGFVLWFFRDPDRIQPDDENAFVSPADGKVIIAEKVHDERFMHKEVIKISIFMNVFNVHVNRFPFKGTVKQVMLKPGRFYSADTEKGALHNEYCALQVATENDMEYCVVQVAGLIARRIVCWTEKGDSLNTGERYGLIRFGSRVDLYLPANFELTITKGDKVRAGETVLGKPINP